MRNFRGTEGFLLTLFCSELRLHNQVALTARAIGPNLSLGQKSITRIA